MAQQLVEEVGVEKHSFSRTGRMALYGGCKLAHTTAALGGIPIDQRYLPTMQVSLDRLQHFGINHWRESNSQTRTYSSLLVSGPTKSPLLRSTYSYSSAPCLSWKERIRRRSWTSRTRLPWWRIIPSGRWFNSSTLRWSHWNIVFFLWISSVWVSVVLMQSFESSWTGLF